MSDLHGEYDKYLTMLSKIDFSEHDLLFILGDIIDRGPKPISILKDMAVRSNVYPIFGNHEIMALDILPDLMVEITEQNYNNHISSTLMSKLLDWQLNGGKSTLDEFQKLPYEERINLLDYMRDFSKYEVIDIADKSFVMVHSGLSNFSPEKQLNEYTLEELVFERSDEDIQLFDDKNIFVISGHTPTLAITGKAEIYCSHNNICIDCGASFPSGRLACICLETMEEFYV